jgi:uncharacterized protein YvpB
MKKKENFTIKIGIIIAVLLSICVMPANAWWNDNYWDDYYGDDLSWENYLDDCVVTGYYDGGNDDNWWDDDWWSNNNDDDWGGGYSDDSFDDPYDDYTPSNNGDNNSGNGNGNNTNNPDTPGPYHPDPNDKMAKPNIPTTMEPQTPNTCVTSIMVFLNHLFGDNIKEGDILSYAAKNLNAWVLYTGVPDDKIIPLVTNYFNITTFDDYKTAIDNGNFVMTDILVGSHTEMFNGEEVTINDGHNVLIVGYDDDNPENLIYMDPQTGTLQIENKDYFDGDYNNGGYNIVITSKK